MRHWFRLDEELCYGSIQADAFMEKLLESGNRAKLQTRCAAKRKLLIDYLQQEGFCGDDHVPVGLVDVGWRCSTQEILQKITDVPVRYYYWGVSSMRVRIGLSGPFISFLLCRRLLGKCMVTTSLLNITFVEIVKELRSAINWRTMALSLYWVNVKIL